MEKSSHFDINLSDIAVISVIMAIFDPKINCIAGVFGYDKIDKGELFV